MSSPRKAGLLFIFITLFLDIFGIGLVVPILPQLIHFFLEGDISASALHFGGLVALYSVMQFVFAPILGSLSDQYGRRPVLLLSMLGSGLDYLLLAYAPHFWWLVVGRAISGITGANITVGMAYIADVTPPEKRAQGFGLVGAAFGLGFVAGPGLGGWLGQYDLRYPFFAAAALTLLNVIYGALVLPESLSQEHRTPFSWSKSNPVSSFKLLQVKPVVGDLTLMFFLANLAQQCLQNIWVLLGTHRFQWNTLQNGLSLTMVGLLSAIVQGGLIRRIMPILGEVKAVKYGLILGIVSFLMYAVAPFGWMMYGIMVISSLAGLSAPAAQSLLSQQFGPGEQGALQGALASVSTLTRVLGPLLATGLFAYFTAPQAPLQLDGAPLFLGALLLLGAYVMVERALRRETMVSANNG